MAWQLAQYHLISGGNNDAAIENMASNVAARQHHD